MCPRIDIDNTLHFIDLKGDHDNLMVRAESCFCHFTWIDIAKVMLLNAPIRLWWILGDISYLKIWKSPPDLSLYDTCLNWRNNQKPLQATWYFLRCTIDSYPAPSEKNVKDHLWATAKRGPCSLWFHTPWHTAGWLWTALEIYDVI